MVRLFYFFVRLVGRNVQLREVSSAGGAKPATLSGMASRPRTECPECSRDVAVTFRGLTWRHDPPSGRTPELKSCPGSLKPVQAPAGDLLLFVSPEASATVPEPEPEPVGLF